MKTAQERLLELIATRTTQEHQVAAKQLLSQLSFMRCDDVIPVEKLLGFMAAVMQEAAAQIKGRDSVRQSTVDELGNVHHNVTLSENVDVKTEMGG